MSDWSNRDSVCQFTDTIIIRHSEKCAAKMWRRNKCSLGCSCTQSLKKVSQFSLNNLKATPMQSSSLVLIRINFVILNYLIVHWELRSYINLSHLKESKRNWCQAEQPKNLLCSLISPKMSKINPVSWLSCQLWVQNIDTISWQIRF